MELSITAVLALFVLLAISSGVFFLSKQLRVPYTVLLVAVGTFILVPLSLMPGFSFLNDFTLTPELLFYIFLPILIFESAYNMSIRRLMENVYSISLLAVIGLIISALAIALALTYTFPLIGIELPFLIALLFGVLISATDPVAVLALFKEYGAPRRLSLIFEGESIFNDGTAVALFLIVLEIALFGFHGVPSILEGILMFLIMVIGGIIMGLVSGGLFAKVIGYARSNEFVSITLTVVLAHITFVGVELMNSHMHVGDFKVHFSAIIATAIASMVMGNYGRSKISPKAEEFVEKFWGQFAFIANSLVFVMIGLIFANLPFEVNEFILPVLCAIIIVAAARALSIYSVLVPLNWTRTEALIPRSWQHLLAWGSLRGALAVTMVMLIPDDFTIPGWVYGFTPKEFILALTIGCIFATLFIKATTIGVFMRRFNIDRFTDIETLAHEEARALMHTRVLARLEDFCRRGYITKEIYEQLKREHSERFAASLERGTSVATSEDSTLPDRVVRLYAIGIERHYLKDLFAYSEISEKVYKRIWGKLQIQQEHIDRGELMTDDSVSRDNKDVFERLANVVRRIFFPSHLVTTYEEQYMYYRAQSIISRKVLVELKELTEAAVFGIPAFTRTLDLYERYRAQAKGKMEAIAEAHPAVAASVGELLARRGILKVEEATLHDLYEKEMLTPKLYITIRDDVEREERTA